jgi:hypothetical protein
MESEETTITPMGVDAESLSLRGVQRLAGAILVQAIEDLRCGSNRRREDAIHWIEEDSETQFSFVFCCRILQRDPEEVRRFLLQREFPNWLFAALLQKSEAASA